MGTKSIREAVETAVVAHLNAQGFGSTATVLPGMSTAKVDPPVVVAIVENIGPHPQIPEGYGNFSARMMVAVRTPANVANAEALHAAACEKVINAMFDEVALRAAFTTIGDAAMYFCTYSTTQDAKGEETFGSDLVYDILGVINP